MSAKPLFVSGWEVVGIRSAEKFFSALAEMLPLPVNVYFEGTSISSDVQALFASSAVKPSLRIPAGTIWPKPSVFHARATEQYSKTTGDAGRKACRTRDLRPFSCLS